MFAYQYLLVIITFFKIVVLFSDGIQNIPPFQKGLERVGKELEKTKIKVFAVMTGKESNIKALLKLCSNDRLLFKKQFLSEMINVMNAEMDYLCWGGRRFSLGCLVS